MASSRANSGAMQRRKKQKTVNEREVQKHRDALGRRRAVAVNKKKGPVAEWGEAYERPTSANEETG